MKKKKEKLSNDPQTRKALLNSNERKMRALRNEIENEISLSASHCFVLIVIEKHERVCKTLRRLNFAMSRKSLPLFSFMLTSRSRIQRKKSCFMGKEKKFLPRTSSAAKRKFDSFGI
jgi:hypothetical protein